MQANMDDAIRGGTLVALVVAMAAVTGIVAGATAGSVTADPAEPTVKSTHTVTATVGEGSAGSSWTGLRVDYNETDVSNVGQEDIKTIGIDRGDDASGATVDVDVSNDLSSVDALEDGTTLVVGLGGNYNLEKGDEVVVVYEDVQNPTAGTYQVGLDVNHQSSGGTTTATLDIGSGSQSGSGDSAAAGEQSKTTASAPGLGVIAAFTAIVGALVAVAARNRRRS